MSRGRGTGWLRTLPAVTAALLAAGCGAGAPAADTAGTLVVTTVAPITDLARQVAGDRAAVVGLVPDGQDSHTFEPRPTDARRLAAADLFIANGLSLEAPALKMAAANLPEDAPIIRLGDQTVTPEEYVYDRSFPEDAGKPNPHLWLDVTYAQAYVAHIADALAAVDPPGAAAYRANAAAYRGVLADLDRAIASAVATIPPGQRKLVTYHDSWAYFGPRYGLEVIAAVQPTDFAEPSAADVRAIIDQIRAAQVAAVFGSEVFPSDVLRTIAADTGVTYVGDLADDVLPGQPGEPDHSYVGMMVHNVRTIVTALGGDAAALEPLGG